MIAIVEIGGKQYTVKVGDKIIVDRQDQEVDATLQVPALLACATDGSALALKSQKVALKVVSHSLGEKLRVFKMKAKKRYARTRGFRAHLSTLEVVSIG